MAEQLPPGFTAVDWVALQMFKARVGRGDFLPENVAGKPELMEKLTDWAYTMADGFMKAQAQRHLKEQQDREAPAPKRASLFDGP